MIFDMMIPLPSLLLLLHTSRLTNNCATFAWLLPANSDFPCWVTMLLKSFRNERVVRNFRMRNCRSKQRETKFWIRGASCRTCAWLVFQKSPMFGIGVLVVEFASSFSLPFVKLTQNAKKPHSRSQVGRSIWLVKFGSKLLLNTLLFTHNLIQVILLKVRTGCLLYVVNWSDRRSIIALERATNQRSS